MKKIKIEIQQIVNGKVYVEAIIEDEHKEFDSLDKAILELTEIYPDREIEIN